VAETVLLIDHDQEALNGLLPIFVSEGYRLHHATPGLDAIRRMRVDRPDLVILALCPEESNWDFCRRLMTFLDTPLLLLLSTKNPMDRVIGLELGADDCMDQPVIAEEVLARVRALLRRGELPVSRLQRSYYVDGDLVVDLTRAEAQLKGEPILLTPIEFRLLSCLITNVGEVLSHEQLARGAWGFEYSGASRPIKQYIYQLRQKLEPTPHHPKRIMTRRGRGYVFKSVEEG
jgi:DNA-binding response OmpR family regulator